MAVPAVPLRGKLEQHSVPVLMRELLRSQRDGCLTVSRGAITRRIYLRDGMIIYASSTEPSDRLGAILVVQGKLSRADHKAYWEQSVESNRLLGITLVVNGRITLHDLYQGVTAQVVTIFNRLQKWRKGDYDFVEGCAPDAGTVLLRLPLALYLKADAEPAPARKKPAQRGAAKPRAAARRTPAAGATDEAETIQIDEVEPEPAVAISPEAAAELERIGEVSFLVQELRKRLGQEPGALLGVPAGADRAAVQAAFHRVARTLHPDRLPKGTSPELALEAEEVFREVTAAAEAAEQALSRRGPEAAASGNRGRVVPEEDQARRFFSKGREWIGKRNYWQAADALRQAVRLSPGEALYRQYLGLALMQTKRLHEAEEHLVEATRLEPDNAAHFVNLGRIYRAGRLFRKAREVFERALRLDPRNEHARDELSDLPEEPPTGRKTDSGGLLKKFFGKG